MAMEMMMMMITRSPSGFVAFAMYMYVCFGLFFPQGEWVLRGHISRLGRQVHRILSWLTDFVSILSWISNCKMHVCSIVVLDCFLVVFLVVWEILVGFLVVWENPCWVFGFSCWGPCWGPCWILLRF